MIRTVDLNADLGEGMPWDFELLARVTSVNVSCGSHAGDPAVIAATLREAKRRGVVAGAHPSWPDREGFGRSERRASPHEVERLILDQVAALKAIAEPIGVTIRYIKPHGALYNQAMRDDSGSVPIATGLLTAAQKLGLALVGLPHTALQLKSRAASVVYVSEGFVDRRYDTSLRLIPRSETNAFITDHDEAVRQAEMLVMTGIASLCLHGDSPGSVELADAILAAFSRDGISVRSFVATN